MIMLKIAAKTSTFTFHQIFQRKAASAMNWLIYGMVYLGSALMVYNVYSYIQYAKHLQEKKDWGKERSILYIPIFLQDFSLIIY